MRHEEDQRCETQEYRIYADLERQSPEHEYVTVLGERLGLRVNPHVYIQFGDDVGLAFTAQQARQLAWSLRRLAALMRWVP